MNKFRLLKEDEIEARIATVTANGLQILLYKDARCDMNVLDETVGPMNWERKHTRDNANCIVSIWDKEKGLWISKEDTGTESFTEKEKGLASDSFKRACFNWGIGRELYTAPFIWIKAKDCSIERKEDARGNKKYTCRDKFVVSKIAYDDQEKISNLEIRNEKTNCVVFKMWTMGPESPETPITVNKMHVAAIRSEIERTGAMEKAVCYQYRITRLEEMTMEQFKNAMDIFKDMPTLPDPAPDGVIQPPPEGEEDLPFK